MKFIPSIRSSKRKKKTKNGLRSDEKLVQGTRGRLDLIAPDGVYMPDDPKGYKVERPSKLPSHIQLSSKRFLRSFVVSELPRQLYVGIFRDLDTIGDVDVSYHLEPAEAQEVVRLLTKELIRLETDAYMRGGAISETDPVLAQSLEDTRALQESISLGNDKIFFATIVVTIGASSLEELEKRTKRLYEFAEGKMMRFRECFLRQDEGLRTTLPIGLNELRDVFRNLNLGAATGLFPFDREDISDPGGVFLGANRYTGAPVFVNTHKPNLDTAHMVFLGRPGSGKTTTLKSYLLRSGAQGIRCCGLDPEGEYRDTIEALGGQYFALNPDMVPAINPFDLESEIVGGKEVVDLKSKIEESKRLLLAMVEGEGNRFPITPEESGILDLAIRKEYIERGITSDPQSLYEPDHRPGYVGLRKKEMPTITSLCERLEREYKENAERLLLRLSRFRREGTMGIFDGQSRWQVSNTPATGFGMSALDNLPELKHIAMLVTSHFIWEHFVKKNPQIRKMVFMDEAWMFAKTQAGLEFWELLARRARKRNTSFLISSQSFREFMDTPEGRAVLQSASITFLMRQSVTDVDDLKALYKLPDGQLNYLVTADKGEGLLRLGGQTAAVRVIVLEHEKPVIFPKELVK